MSRREARRVLLLDAARQVVLRFGYRKTTLEDIAAAAGVSRATVYNYFDSKEDVFRSLISQELGRLRQAIDDRIDPSAPPDVRLVVWNRARFEHFRQLRAMYSVAFEAAREALPAAMDELAAYQAEQVAFLDGLLREGVASGQFRAVDVDALAPALLGALRGLEEAFLFEDRDALELGAQVLVDTLIRGLLTTEASP